MKKGTYFFIIFVIIVLGVLVGTTTSKNEVLNGTKNETKENNTTNNSVVENKVEENIIEEENKVEENTQVDNSTTTTSTSSQDKRTDKEKAIDIVKKDYGTTSGIEYFVEDERDGKGRYRVVVRDANTTAALAWYFVDVEHNTFDKR